MADTQLLSFYSPRWITEWLMKAIKCPKIDLGAFWRPRWFRQKKFLKLVVISQALKKDYLRQFLFLKDEMVVVSHDAADLPMITADKNENKKIVVGYVGHLYAGRGIELILGMAKRRPSLSFELVGGQKEDVINWKDKSSKPAKCGLQGT